MMRKQDQQQQSTRKTTLNELEELTDGKCEQLLSNMYFLPKDHARQDRQAGRHENRHQSARDTDRQFDTERTSIFVFGQTTGVVSCFTALHQQSNPTQDNALLSELG